MCRVYMYTLHTPGGHAHLGNNILLLMLNSDGKGALIPSSKNLVRAAT